MSTWTGSTLHCDAVGDDGYACAQWYPDSTRAVTLVELRRWARKDGWIRVKRWHRMWDICCRCARRQQGPRFPELGVNAEGVPMQAEEC